MSDNLNLFSGPVSSKNIIVEASVDNIVKKIQSLVHKQNYDEIFFDWVRCMFYTYSNTCNKIGAEDREEKYKNIVKKYGKGIIDIFIDCNVDLIQLFEKNIDDYLGKIHHKLEIT